MRSVIPTSAGARIVDRLHNIRCLTSRRCLLEARQLLTLITSDEIAAHRNPTEAMSLYDAVTAQLNAAEQLAVHDAEVARTTSMLVGAVDYDFRPEVEKIVARMNALFEHEPAQLPAPLTFDDAPPRLHRWTQLRRVDPSLPFQKDNLHWERASWAAKANTVWITHGKFTLARKTWAEIMGIDQMRVTPRQLPVLLAEHADAVKANFWRYADKDRGLVSPEEV